MALIEIVAKALFGLRQGSLLRSGHSRGEISHMMCGYAIPIGYNRRALIT